MLLARRDPHMMRSMVKNGSISLAGKGRLALLREVSIPIPTTWSRGVQRLRHLSAPPVPPCRMALSLLSSSPPSSSLSSVRGTDTLGSKRWVYKRGFHFEAFWEKGTCRRRFSSKSSSQDHSDRESKLEEVMMVQAASKEREEVRRLCEKGGWQEASRTLCSMRENGLKPVMLAYVDVITACRRALQWESAREMYSEMVDVHFSYGDIFREGACDDYEDESQSVLARAFGIVAEMSEDGVEPNSDTYRTLLHYCRDEACWQMAILLVEHARRSKTKLDLFSFDHLLVTLSEQQGLVEVATMLYEQWVVEGDKDLLEAGDYDMNWPLHPVGKSFKLELHNLTESTALATVRIALLDVTRRSLTRTYWSGTKPFLIITGAGNNSRDGEAVIRPAVAQMLEDMGLKPEFQQNNEGCIEIMPVNLEAYAKRIRSPAPESPSVAET